MCYTVLLSTTSAEDLSALSTDLFRFDAQLPQDDAMTFLKYPNRWYVASRHNCSCGFRHAMSPDLGFSCPVEWYGEEEADLTATRKLAAVLRQLIESGNSVDCMSVWEGRGDAAIHEMQVDFSQTRDDEFRFFENYRFELRGVAKPPK